MGFEKGDLSKEDIKKMMEEDKEERRIKKQKRWKNIEKIIENNGGLANLSQRDVLNLIHLEDNDDLDSLEDIEKLGFSGYFVSEMASNTDAKVSARIEKGKIIKADLRDFQAYGGSMHGKLYEDYEDYQRSKAYEEDQKNN